MRPELPCKMPANTRGSLYKSIRAMEMMRVRTYSPREHKGERDSCHTHNHDVSDQVIKIADLEHNRFQLAARK